MSKRKKTAATAVNAIAEHAQDLLEATAGVAEERVAEARDRLGNALAQGKEWYGDAVQSAISRARVSDKFIRDNRYAVLGIGVVVGILIGFLMRSGDEQ